MNSLHEKYGIDKNLIITVAGNVGVGKSTFTKALAKALDYETSFEKVDGNPYLDLFYHDFARWSFHLQIYFLAERFKEQRRMFEMGCGFVQDRSIYEDTGIFAKMLFEKGNMTDVDYATYVSLFEAMVLTPYFPKPDVLIYLEGEFEDVLKRIKERGREMEQNTPIEYWEEMYSRYQNWIDSFEECEVIRVNINEYDVINDPSSIEKIIEKISVKINNSKQTI